jgi:hypothetical protein
MTNSMASRRPIPGPADRETFVDEQRRHRRAARLFGAVSLLTAALIGAGVAALFTPTLYLLIAIGLIATALAACQRWVAGEGETSRSPVLMEVALRGPRPGA